MLRVLSSCLLVLCLCGCAFDPPVGGDKIPPPPINDSPQGALLRLGYIYEQQALPLYEPLLTSDFRYTFSVASDPELVDRYPNWGRDDEVESTQHLFEGFRNSLGQSVPRASRITLDLTGVQYGPDPTNPDSAAWYQRVVVTSVDLAVVIGEDTYEASGRHEFYFVRGDAAVLDAGQETRPDRWYLKRWDDLSPRLAAGSPPQAVTWGGVRDLLAP
jgi:hypothetical protein